MEQEILKCIQQLEAEKQEITVSAIRQRTGLESELINEFLQSHSSTVVGTVVGVTSQARTNSNDYPIKGQDKPFIEQPMPLLIEATMFQMQKSFSDMGNSLWSSVAKSAQQVLDIEKEKLSQQMHSKAKEMQSISEKLNELQKQLSDSQIALQTQLRTEAAINKENQALRLELNSKLDENSDLTKALAALSQSNEDNKRLNQVDQQALDRLEQQELITQKVLERTAKEKEFITKELKSIQKELFLSDSIINDLYTENIIDGQFLENYSYDKHQRIITKSSLTKKVFDK